MRRRKVGRLSKPGDLMWFVFLSSGARRYLHSFLNIGTGQGLSNRGAKDSKGSMRFGGCVAAASINCWISRLVMVSAWCPEVLFLAASFDPGTSCSYWRVGLPASSNRGLAG